MSKCLESKGTPTTSLMKKCNNVDINVFNEVKTNSQRIIIEYNNFDGKSFNGDACT